MNESEITINIMVLACRTDFWLTQDWHAVADCLDSRIGTCPHAICPENYEESGEKTKLRDCRINLMSCLTCNNCNIGGMNEDAI